MRKPTRRQVYAGCLGIAVCVASVGAVYLGAVIIRYDVETRFAAQLESHGAYADTANRTPRLLESMFGRIRYFDRIVEIGIYDRPLTGEEIETISGCRELRLVYLTNVDLTDAQLREIRLPRAATLDLSDNLLTEASFSIIVEFPELETVVLSDNKLDREVVAEFRKKAFPLEVIY